MEKICHISSVHNALDTRVFFKECVSLANAGYDVSLIARFNKESEIKDGVKIVPFTNYSNRIKRVMFSAFRMLKMALKEKAVLYHFHDPELIPVGVMLSWMGKKVIYDVHEDVAKQLLDKSYFRFKWMARTMAVLARLTEKIGSVFFSRIVAATPGIAKNFKPSKTTIVRNVPLLNLFRADTPVDLKKEKPVVGYVGVLSRTRGLVQMVKAMEYVGDKAELWLVGNWETEEMHRECREMLRKDTYPGERQRNRDDGATMHVDSGRANHIPRFFSQGETQDQGEDADPIQEGDQRKPTHHWKR